MKKLFATGFAACLLLLLSPMISFAKKVGATPAFSKGDNAIGIGLGLGPAHTYGLADAYSPAFMLTYEHGIIDGLGPGTLSIGGEIGYQTSRYDYAYGGYRARWTTLTVAVRGIYHLTLLKDKNNKFDPYGGVAVGFYSVSYDNDYPGPKESYGSAPLIAPFVGAKYNFAKAVGAWAEVGYDIAILKVGLNFNF
ncbi:MAG: outer membrane beta-barrel protein [Bacteroidetes bacterium]|nr:outer membrane beta-barrel protein [Bacteroidota bacterium]MBS1628725.1 outer membrane beta-barrel protein [Bacteroidota bacterium]